MKRLKNVPWAAALCGLIAAFDLVVGVATGNWGLLAAGVFLAALAALNLHLSRSTRKAKKTVPSPFLHNSGGYASGGNVTSIDLSKYFTQALTTRAELAAKALTPPAKKEPAGFHGLPFEFAVGEVYGLRMWHMDKYGRLRARNWDGAPPWRPGVNVARCVKRRLTEPSGYSFFTSDYSWSVQENPGHDVPSEECACGFYAYTDDLHAEVKKYVKDGEEPVLGIIKGTGRTLIGTQGFRCEKAEIVAFRDPTRGGAKTDAWRTRQLARLRRVYPDIPILDNRAALLEFAPITETVPQPSDEAFWSLP